jgi:hypothetical protein
MAGGGNISVNNVNGANKSQFTAGDYTWSTIEVIKANRRQ